MVGIHLELVGTNAVGCTIHRHIYIDSTCAIREVYMNEASNSNVFAGRSNAPIDPYSRQHAGAYGVARCG